MSNPNAPLPALPIAPIRTPIHEIDHDQLGVPVLQRKESGDFSGITPPWIGWFEAVTSRLNALPVLQDTHANRVANYPAANYTNFLFYEFDRGVFYISRGGVWIYVAGEGPFTQATLPADLGANDVGFIAQVQDYNHMLAWGGAAWGWATGDGGNRKIELFTATPGTGWHLCDGSSVHFLNANGTLGTETLPNMVGNPVYLKATSAYSSTVNLHAIPQVPSENTGGPSATTTVQSGAGATVASSTHTHTVPAEATTVSGDMVDNITMLAYYRQ